MDRSQHYCISKIDPTAGQRKPQLFTGVPDNCDLCGKPIHLGHFFADVQLPNSTQWAYACQMCIADHQMQFGWGEGQLYQNQAGNSEHWLLVAGFPTD